MNAEEWQKVRSILESALELDPDSRASFVDGACAGDKDLRREVLSLLSEHEQPGRFLDAPALEMVRHAVEDQAQRDKERELALLGRKISHYRILQKLGGGGMGVVYRAEDTRLHRFVALKFLPEEMSQDAQALERFTREAQAASALNHPHICTIYDIGESEEGPFIVMELLEGNTLKHRISGKPLTPDSVVELGIHIAEALEAAHSKGILHRDIKPANIFVTERGQAKLLDFGLAKLTRSMAETVASQDAPTGTAQRLPAQDLTLPGARMGTAAYMSPEQVRGEPLDARSDIFSFGAVLYEMATGGPTFRGETSGELIQAILNEAPGKPSALNPAVPLRLEQVILRALAKERSARYQTTAELLSDLRELQQPKPRQPVLVRFLLVSSTLALVAFIAILAFRRSQTSGAPEISQQQVTANPDDDSVYNAAVTEDGKQLAYGDLEGLHIRTIDSGEVHSVTLPGVCFR